MKGDIFHDPLFLSALKKGGAGGSASGDIVTFTGDGSPLRSLRVGIDPVQEGTGDPSPDNVRPISGWSAANLWRTGKNLCSVSSWSGHSGLAGTLDTPIPPNTTFTMSGSFTRDGAATNGCAILFGFSDGTDSGWTSLTVNSGERKSATKTFPKEIVSVKYYASNVGWSDSQNYTLTAEDFQIELGSTPTPYAPYTGNQYTIQLGQTVYGGYISVSEDGSAELVVDRVIIPDTLANAATRYTADNGWYWYASLGMVRMPEVKDTNAGVVLNRLKTASNVSATSDEGVFTLYANGIMRWKEQGALSQEDYRTYLESNPLQIIYELATPITIPLTPTQISTLAGQNVMWADCGDIAVEWAGGKGFGKDAMLAWVMHR